jgi:hypothetical protein
MILIEMSKESKEIPVTGRGCRKTNGRSTLFSIFYQLIHRNLPYFQEMQHPLVGKFYFNFLWNLG